jgi:exodeoxyribonuclease V gamma subunit
LAIVVDLRDRGLREPLPLYVATSHRYVSARRDGSEEPFADAARAWTSEWGWDKEDREDEHLLVLGGQISFDEVLAAAPAADEAGEGWAMDEATRFGRLARRLWDPVFTAAVRGEPARVGQP